MIQQAISKLIEQQDLSTTLMTDVMTEIMSGQASPAQIASFLVALRMKGETVTEITAAAKLMYQYATKCPIQKPHLIDIVGTGGDGAKTFNISTTVAFVVAAAGGQVAKHGNRSVSSSSGSADVLEAAGLNLDLSPAQVANCVEQLGIGFLFAPKYHGAMKHAAAPRKELGIRTLFNILGPLTNPAGAQYQLIGVYDKHWVKPMAQVLKNLGSKGAWVVHSHDGLDELSIASPSTIAELKDNEITVFELNPKDYHLYHPSLASLRVENPQQSHQMLTSVLNHTTSPALDIVLLNAAAALYVAKICNSFEQGIEQAKAVINNGSAHQKYQDLIKLSHQV